MVGRSRNEHAVIYKKHQIELAARQQEDGRWVCQYVIIEFGPRHWRYNKGFPDGRFGTRQQAEAAALKQARRIINSFMT
ncbi:MAG: hypothetical protein H8K04_07050 [Nitrospira sp.]